MTLPLVGAGFAGLAAFLFVAWVLPALNAIEAEHRASRPRRMIMDDYGLRGLTALAERYVGPMFATTIFALDQKLRVAGRPWGGISGSEYLGLGIVAICVGFLVGFVANVFLIGAKWALLFGWVVAGVVFLVWWLAISDLVKRRRENTWREFPFFLDTLTMTMQAGATLPQALKIYVRSNEGATLARDLADALNRAEAGADILVATEETLERVTIDEIAVTMKAILEAERMGADRLRLLRDNATDIRSKRWEQAERASEVLKTKITLPTMFIMIAVVILILAPAVVEIGSSGLF